MKLKLTSILSPAIATVSSSALHFSHRACSNNEGTTNSFDAPLSRKSESWTKLLLYSDLSLSSQSIVVHVVAIFVESTKTIALPLHSPELELALPLHSPELESIHHVSSKLRKVWKRSRSQQQCIEPRVCCQGYGHCILPILT